MFTRFFFAKGYFRPFFTSKRFCPVLNSPRLNCVKIAIVWDTVLNSPAVSEEEWARIKRDEHFPVHSKGSDIYSSGFFSIQIISNQCHFVDLIVSGVPFLKITSLACNKSFHYMKKTNPYKSFLLVILPMLNTMYQS